MRISVLLLLLLVSFGCEKSPKGFVPEIPEKVSPAVSSPEEQYRKGWEGLAPIMLNSDNPYALDQLRVRAAPSVSLIRNAADREYAPAQYLLAWVYARHLAGDASQFDGVSAESVEWFQRAAANDHWESQLFLYDLAEQVPNFSPQDRVDLGKQLSFSLQRAATQGDPRAQFFLSAFYLEGGLVEISKDESKGEYWRDKSMQSYPHACWLVAIGLEGGIDDPVPPKVLDLYARAAEQGQLDSQLRLAHLYRFGRPGLEKDERVARKWYLRVASQPIVPSPLPDFDFELLDRHRRSAIVEAQWQVAQDLLLDGAGGSLPSGIFWMRKAAEHGDSQAQRSLGIRYSKGEGVPKDFVLGYMWLNLSAARFGHSFNIDQRDELAEKMTPEQVAEAQRLSREWVSK